MNLQTGTTTRLQIEPLEKRHAALLFEVLQDTRIYEFIPQDPPQSPESLENRFEFLERRKSSDGTESWLNWALRLHDSDRFIGTIQATILSDRTAFIGYTLCPRFWRKGYGRESIAWLLEELMRNWNVDEVKAEVDTRNEASVRLLERLGFEQVGFKPNADHFKGQISDEYTYRWVAPEP